MIYFLLYSLTTVDKLVSVCTWLSVSLCLVLPVAFALYMEEDKPEDLGRYIKTGFKVLCISSLLAILIPDKEESLMILGGGATYEVLTSKEAKETGGKVLEIVNKYLDKELKENTK